MREEELVQRLSYSPEAAWDFLADLRNDPLWRGEIEKVELVAGTAREPDAQYREVVVWEGIRAEASITTPELERGVRLLVDARDPGYQSKYTYQFTSHGNGCEVRLRMCLETTGPLRLIEPFMWAIITRWLEQSLSNLDRAIAAHVAPGDAAIPAASGA